LEARPGGRLWADWPTLLPGEVRAGLALRRAAVLALLATLPAPPTIPPRRWAVLAATSARLLRDHGAALHGAGWDALHLFGLDATALATNSPGWGLAWLLGEHGEVLDVAPEAVGMRQGAGGARLAYRAAGRVGAGGGGASMGAVAGKPRRLHLRLTVQSRARMGVRTIRPHVFNVGRRTWTRSQLRRAAWPGSLIPKHQSAGTAGHQRRPARW